MKYFSQINKILTKKQKKAMFFLTILIIISMSFEILTLNSIFILLSYMTNPMSINDSQIFIYLKNLKLNYDINLVIVIFYKYFYSKNTNQYFFKLERKQIFIFYSRGT